MQYTIFDVPVLRSILRWVSMLYLRMIGWRWEGKLPDEPKYVIIVAPHTSNWDFPIGLAIAFATRFKGYWFGKDKLFRRPFGWFVRWLGGIPIDRSKSSDVVAQVIRVFTERERMALVLTPEGTRRKVAGWKTGFYHIARGANVPIVMAFLDYLHKTGGFGPLLKPSGDIRADMEVIRAFYTTVTARYPDKQAPVALMPGKTGG